MTRGRRLLLELLVAEALTHAQLARRCGIARSTLTALADGTRSPSLAHAFAISWRAGVPPESWLQEASGSNVRLVARADVTLTEPPLIAANEGSQ